MIRNEEGYVATRNVPSESYKAIWCVVVSLAIAATSALSCDYGMDKSKRIKLQHCGIFLPLPYRKYLRDKRILTYLNGILQNLNDSFIQNFDDFQFQCWSLGRGSFMYWTRGSWVFYYILLSNLKSSRTLLLLNLTDNRNRPDIIPYSTKLSNLAVLAYHIYLIYYSEQLWVL